MSNPELELLDRQIAEGQQVLRDLHSQKRRANVAERFAVTHKAASEARDQGLELVSVMEVSSSVVHGGLPTPVEQIDMTNSQPVLVNTQLSEEKLSPRDAMFLEGSNNQRGPQLVSLFKREGRKT